MAHATDVAPQIDVTPSDTRPQPPRPRRTFNWKKWRARLVVTLMIAAAAYGGLRLADSRSAVVAQFPLDTVTLTGQAIPVETQRTGQVTSVLVGAQQQVARGQRLGTVVVTKTDRDGDDVRTSVPLTAPADGVILDTPAPVGSIVQPGTPFVELYDPSTLTFESSVRSQDLSRIAPGMVATLNAEGLDEPVQAVVQRIVPRVEGVTPTVGAPQVSSNRLEVVLKPTDAAQVGRLVPGLRFRGTVDTRTGGATDGLHIAR